jgi:dTDP-4-dehydrorhamnose 3,5-epimerase
MEWKRGKIEGVAVLDLERHEDSRGYLIETFRRDELPNSIEPAMGYVSVTLPGQSRGPHEHVHQTDIFSFTGPGDFRLVLWDNREDSPTYGNSAEYTLGDERFATVIVPPGVVHGYTNISDKPATVLNYPDRLYRGEGRGEAVDEIRHEDDADTPFKL